MPKKPCRFAVGETVSLERWNRYERKPHRLFNCIVTAIEPARCESGWMVTVAAIDGRTQTLDSNWLLKKETEQATLL
jgi:hypothetical protein